MVLDQNFYICEMEELPCFDTKAWLTHDKFNYLVNWGKNDCTHVSHQRTSKIELKTKQTRQNNAYNCWMQSIFTMPFLVLSILLSMHSKFQSHFCLCEQGRQQWQSTRREECMLLSWCQKSYMLKNATINASSCLVDKKWCILCGLRIYYIFFPHIVTLNQSNLYPRHKSSISI